MVNLLKDLGVGVIGGPQGPKALLDAVRQAVQEGSLDTLQRLSREFLVINDNVAKCVDDNGNTIAHLALGRNTTTLEYVINELQADVNAPNSQGRTPLHEAVTKNYVECCEVLLASGADDSIQSCTLSTPFHTAAACGSVECMELLLNHSTDPATKVNELDKNRSSALHKCAFDGDVRVSRWLVEHGAAVDARDSQDLTPLLVAVKMGQKDVTEYLLQQKADCNRRDVKGNSPVHFCAVRCDTTILRMLLDAGASPCLQNDDLNNPLHVAALHQRPDSKEWEELISMLLLAGTDPRQENASRKIPADFVGRSLKKLFSKEEVLRRRELESKAQREAEEDLEKAMALRCTWRVLVKQNLGQRKALEDAEDERMAKELESYQHAEEDARIVFEEAVETLRFQDEEIKKKRAAVEKASAKAGGK